MALTLLQSLQATTTNSTTATSPDFFGGSNSDYNAEIDPQFDTGTVGSDIMYIGNGLEDGTAVFIYGLAAGLQCVVPLAVYMLTQLSPNTGTGAVPTTTTSTTGTTGTTTTTTPTTTPTTTTLTYPGYLPLKTFVYVFMGIWAPTFFTWMGVVFFDSQEMRNLFHEAIHLSTAGPFVLYWLAMGDILINARWTDWVWWTILVVMFLYSAASICYQAIFVPRVTNWISTTPIKIYPAAAEVQQQATNTITASNDVAYVAPGQNLAVAF